MKCSSEEEVLKQRERCRRWYREHREKRLRQICEYGKSNRAKKREYERKWYAKSTSTLEGVLKHRNRINRYRNTHKKQVAEANKAWLKRNPGHRKNTDFKRRVLETAAAVNLKAIKKWINNVKSKSSAVCYYCCSTISANQIHFDHIVPLSRGGNHSPENLCVSCQRCNQSKGAKSLRIWITTGQQLLEL